MATQVSLHDDMYLALLASRAVTGLAKLAADPDTRDNSVLQQIRSGLDFCAQIGTSEEAANPPAGIPELTSVLKRLSTKLPQAKVFVTPDEVRSTAALLQEIVERRSRVNNERLRQAVDFFMKASSGQGLAIAPDQALFAR